MDYIHSGTKLTRNLLNDIIKTANNAHVNVLGDSTVKVTNSSNKSVIGLKSRNRSDAFEVTPELFSLKSASPVKYVYRDKMSGELLPNINSLYIYIGDSVLNVYRNCRTFNDVGEYINVNSIGYIIPGKLNIPSTYIGYPKAYKLNSSNQETEIPIDTIIKIVDDDIDDNGFVELPFPAGYDSEDSDGKFLVTNNTLGQCISWYDDSLSTATRTEFTFTLIPMPDSWLDYVNPEAPIDKKIAEYNFYSTLSSFCGFNSNTMYLQTFKNNSEDLSALSTTANYGFNSTNTLGSQMMDYGPQIMPFKFNLMYMFHRDLITPDLTYRQLEGSRHQWVSYIPNTYYSNIISNELVRFTQDTNNGGNLFFGVTEEDKAAGWQVNAFAGSTYSQGGQKQVPVLIWHNPSLYGSSETSPWGDETEMDIQPGIWACPKWDTRINAIVWMLRGVRTEYDNTPYGVPRMKPILLSYADNRKTDILAAQRNCPVCHSIDIRTLYSYPVVDRAYSAEILSSSPLISSDLSGSFSSLEYRPVSAYNYTPDDSNLSGEIRTKLQVYGFDWKEALSSISTSAITSGGTLLSDIQYDVLVRKHQTDLSSGAMMEYAPLSAIGGAGWVTNAPQGAYETTNYSYDAKVTVLYFGPIS